MNIRAQDENESVVCTNCGGRKFIEDYQRGEQTCTSCGIVVSQYKIDTGPEWRAFTAEEREARGRTGLPMTLTISDKGLTTMISWSDRDASGRSISGSQRAALYRMRKWQIRAMSHGTIHRNISQAMVEMDRLTSQLGIPRETREPAAFIYRKAVQKRLVRGSTIDGMVAASVYLACRICKIPRQLDEIASEAKVGRKTLGFCVRKILQFVTPKVPLLSPLDFVTKLSSELHMKPKTVQRTVSILRNAIDRGLTTGKDPSGIVAAALYVAGILENDRKTQREIATTAKVTEVTVRNRYKDLVKALDIVIDKSYDIPIYNVTE
ncbi:MAG: transcription initiation factor IIB [Candidatus Thorarchaeota archaeon]|nr:transcription initiation factor IIB [Candidatus Thorarchaeota archaeon]